MSRALIREGLEPPELSTLSVLFIKVLPLKPWRPLILPNSKKRQRRAWGHCFSESPRSWLGQKGPQSAVFPVSDPLRTGELPSCDMSSSSAEMALRGAASQGRMKMLRKPVGEVGRPEEIRLLIIVVTLAVSRVTFFLSPCWDICPLKWEEFDFLFSLWFGLSYLNSLLSISSSPSCSFQRQNFILWCSQCRRSD